MRSVSQNLYLRNLSDETLEVLTLLQINTGKVVGGEKTPQVITKVLSDMTQMKGRQDNMDGRLMAMKLENEALWRELSLLRQKHIKQQQIVNKVVKLKLLIRKQLHEHCQI